MKPENVPATPASTDEPVGDLTPDERRARDERFSQLAEEGDPVRNAPLMTRKIVAEFRADPDLLQLRLRQADDRAQREAVKRAEAERMSSTRRALEEEIASRRASRAPETSPAVPAWLRERSFRKKDEAVSAFE